MRIAIPVITFSGSGGGRVLSELANQWVRRQHQVTFIAADAKSTPYFPTEAEVLTTATNSYAGPVGSLIRLSKLIRAEATRFDVILANHHLTAWAVWLAGTEARKRAFYYVQAYEPDFYVGYKSLLRGSVLRMLAKLSYALFDRVIVNAPLYLDYLEIEAIGWVPPGIDFSKFFPRRDRERNNTAAVAIGCIGRRERWKGTLDVFEAARILVNRGQPVRLFSAFYACPDFPDLSVEVPVPRNDKELGDFYRSCDVVVAPGHIQLGAPHYPVMEALACGVPVITTGYLPATEESAWIVPSNDPTSIANAVLEIVSHSAEAAARADKGLYVIKDYSWEAAANKFLTLFEEHR